MNNLVSTDFHELIELIQKHDGINDKAALSKLVSRQFSMTRDRSVYSCSSFSIRFSKASGNQFSNTVLSLSCLQKYDHKPFLVCVVYKDRNVLFLGNSTFLKKVSHSSQQLRADNIKGSFNGSDINRDFQGIPNTKENFSRLYSIHQEIGFEGNLTRLVEATTDIVPTGKKIEISEEKICVIKDAPQRAYQFINSKYFGELKNDLDKKVKKFQKEILLAALIENVNVRGRVIEYLIAGEDENLRTAIVDTLLKGNQNLPRFSTDNALGDYSKDFGAYFTETDVKTKIMVLESNPKGYNIDKMLEFLSIGKTVFMFYFIGINPMTITNTVLVSIFQPKLLKGTILLKHWAGRNSRGVTQFEGKIIKDLINSSESGVDIEEAKRFIRNLISL